MSQPGDLSDVEKQRRLAELQRRLTGQRLPEDFTNGATDTVLLRYLAARGFDVDKALAVRPHSQPCGQGSGPESKRAGGAGARVALEECPPRVPVVAAIVGPPAPRRAPRRAPVLRTVLHAAAQGLHSTRAGACAAQRPR